VNIPEDACRKIMIPEWIAFVWQRGTSCPLFTTNALSSRRAASSPMDEISSTSTAAVPGYVDRILKN
jgi:hypothetical protein